MYVAEGRLAIVGLSLGRRKYSRIVGFIFVGILMVVFVRRWILYKTMMGVAITTHAHVQYRTAQFEIITTSKKWITASNPLKVLHGTNPAGLENRDQGRSTLPPPQSSFVKGHSGVSCEEVRNGTKRAAKAGKKYVSLSLSNVDSRRMGNQLFNLAAILLVAKATGRVPLFPAGWLDNAFDLGVERIVRPRTGIRPEMCPCYTFHERHSMHFDGRLSNIGDLPEKGLLLNGYFQSWRYLEYVGPELRCRLRFRERVRKAAERFLVDNLPTEWEMGTYARIGVHVRRADFLSPRLLQHGYTTPTMTYFRSAFGYFRKRYSRIQLVVTSDDLDWTKKNLSKFRRSNVSVTFSENNTGPVDFAILASCQALVLSTGTFGWWAAWLANVTTVYFKDWPLPGSVLESHLKREDFFPPHWITV